eukprot:07426_5
MSMVRSNCLPRWKAASSRTGQAPTADEKFERVDVLVPVISAACCTPRQHALLGLRRDGQAEPGCQTNEGDKNPCDQTQPCRTPRQHALLRLV